MKSNKLIESRSKLSLNEQRLLLKACSMISKDQEEFYECVFTVKEFMEEFDCKINYEDIKETVRKLHKQTIEIEDNHKWECYSVLSYSKYMKDQGVIKLHFDKVMVPYLLKLKERFTSYRMIHVASLKKTYSLRVYELLKQYEKIGKRILKVKKFLEYLDIADTNSYSIYGNFHCHILEPSIEEINDKTDLKISYKEIKIGRKVDSLIFFIKNKEVLLDKTKSSIPIPDEGQVYEEDGDRITEKEFTKEFLDRLSKEELSSPSRKVKHKSSEKKDVMKKAIIKHGLEYVHHEYLKEFDQKGSDVSYIDFYYRLCKLVSS